MKLVPVYIVVQMPYNFASFISYFLFVFLILLIYIKFLLFSA